MSKALVIYANGSEDMEVTASADILARGGVEVTRAALNDTGSREVTLAHGTVVVCDKNLNDCTDTYDVIVIPGGLQGSEHCRDSKVLTDMLKAQHAAGRYVAAICAAPGFVLATHGIIDDTTKATGYPGCSDNIKCYENAPCVVDADKKVITGRGPAYSMVFGFAILETLKGKAVCDQVKAGMLFPDL